MEVSPKYLVMVTDVNNNKYYKMIPNGNSFDVEFGRIGASCQHATYPMSKWNSKYNEKIKKGYSDQTSIVAISATSATETFEPITDISIKELVDFLQTVARAHIRSNYTIGSENVTQAMVTKAQKILENLMLMSKVEDFNPLLLELFQVIPRRMSSVASYLSQSISEFPNIISREQDLLDVMKGQVIVNIAPNAVNHNITILESLGIEIQKADADDVKIIKKSLGSSASHFVEGWKAVNKKTQEVFDLNYKGEAKKLLWHGSRNENWWSILNSGLMLRPTSAIINGKMFGYGLYFATEPMKAMNYTSINGSYWANGSSNVAFMALYDVLYGVPYDTYNFDSSYYKLDYAALQRLKNGAGCLHAHKDKGMLRNDEIIVYKEAQTTIKYLVKLK